MCAHGKVYVCYMDIEDRTAINRLSNRRFNPDDLCDAAIITHQTEADEAREPTLLAKVLSDYAGVFFGSLRVNAESM